MGTIHKTILPYVYQDHNKYYIRQGKTVYGRYSTKEEAVTHRDKLIREGTIIPKNRGGIKEYDNRYIYKNESGNYTIQKMVNGVLEHFGTYRNLEDARSERDFLENIGWNWDEIEL